MMNRAGLRFLAVALWGCAVLATALSGCGDSAPLLEVQVSGLPSEVVRLSVHASLNGQTAVNQIDGTLDHFFLRLLSGSLTPGTLALEISGLAPDGCQLVSGQTQVAVPVTAPVALTLTPNRGCRVVLTKVGQGSGQVRTADGARTCMFDGKPSASQADPSCVPDAADGANACAFCFPFGTAVNLVPQTGSGSYFSSWTGDCTGKDCALQVGAGVQRVQATFVPRQLCSVDHICFEHPLPGAISTSSVVAISTDDAWLVGGAGLILRWNGSAWLPQESGTTNTLNAAWGQNSNDVWIVGDAGTVLRWDGRTLTKIPIDTRNALVGITGGPSGVWAIDPDCIWRWDGTAFKQFLLASDVLNGISQSPQGEVWVVGDAGTVLFWDGQQVLDYSGLMPFGNRTITSVWAAGPQECFAVGSGLTLHIANDNVQLDGSTDANVIDDYNAVWGTSPRDVWAAGTRGSLAHWDGTAWATVPRSQLVTLTGISGNRTDDFWVVGSGGTILRWNGAFFLSHSASSTELDLRGITNLGSDYLIVGGNVRTEDGGVALRGHVGSWGPLQVQFGVLGARTAKHAVWARSDKRAWSVGPRGAIAEWVGITPTEYDDVLAQTPSELNAIWGVSPTEIYAAGGNGELLKYTGPGPMYTWPKVTTTPVFATTQTFYGIGGGYDGTGATDLWLVGSSGAIWRGNGVRFNQLPLPPSIRPDTTLRAVWWISPSQVWIGGGTLLRWDGSNLNLMPLANQGQLREITAIWGTGPNDVWLTGDDGGIWHYTGTLPVPRLQSGFAEPLYGIAGNQDGGKNEVIFVGSGGAILRYNP